MSFNPQNHHRKSLHLKYYDYSKHGAYFVTICTYQNQHLFGRIRAEEMQLSSSGQMVSDVWNDLPNRFKDIKLDVSILMPNHFHGIVIINPRSGEPCDHPPCKARDHQNCTEGEHKVRPYKGRPNGTRADSLGRIIQAFKSITTTEYIKGVKLLGWPTFSKKIWQRDYYERVIRNDRELDEIREYIINNVLKWDLEKNQPE